MSPFSHPGVLLFLGLVDNDGYERILDAQRRGLRWNVGRQRRLRAVVQTTAYVLLILAFLGIGLLTATSLGPHL